jgi:TonB family protein
MNERKGFLLPAAVLVSLALHFSAFVILLPAVSSVTPPPQLDYIVVDMELQSGPSLPGPPGAALSLPEKLKEETGPQLPEPIGEPAKELPIEPLSELSNEPPVEQQFLENTFSPEAEVTPQEEIPAEIGSGNALASEYASQASGGSSLSGGTTGAGVPGGFAGDSGGYVGVPGGYAGSGGGGSSSNGPPYGGGTSRPPYLPEERHFIPFYQVDRKPEIIERAALGYPVQAKRRNLEGTVIVEADIDETGKIINVRVVKEAGFGFDEAAIAYIKESQFSPAYVGKKPVAVRMRFTVTFSLKD